MTVLDQCFDITVAAEGGLSLDHGDSGNWTGGAVGKGQPLGTKFGISAARYPNLDIAAVTIEQARGYFDLDYFTPAHCHEMPGPLACLVADTAYNGGMPLVWLQKALQPVYAGRVDGVWGKMSKAAAAAPQSLEQRKTVIVAFLAQRIRYLAGLSNYSANPGWDTRVISLAYSCLTVEE